MKTDIAEKIEILEAEQKQLPDKLEFLLYDNGFGMKSENMKIYYSEKMKLLPFEREREYVTLTVGKESGAHMNLRIDNFDIKHPRITSIELRERFRCVDAFYRDKSNYLLSFLRMHDTIKYDGNVPEDKLQKYLPEEQFNKYDEMLNKLFKKYDFNYYYNLYHSKTAA